MKNKIAEAVCIATQKTNYSCKHIKSLCEKRGVRGACAYCNVMAEELIANGVTLADHPTEKDERVNEWLHSDIDDLIDMEYPTEKGGVQE